MKPEWRRFAPVGLYLSLIAALIAIVWFVVEREWNLPVQISCGVVVLGLAVFALLDPDRVRRAFTGRQARHGSNALVLSLAFLGIIIVINYLVFQNSKRWDLTADKQFTLAQETLDTLKSLNEPVLARAFFTAQTSTETAKGLLDQYTFYGNDKFNYEFINPDADPVAAEQAKITKDGTIVLVMGNRQEPVTYASEQELTGALVRLMTTDPKTIYFLIGHGEHNPEDSGEQSYSLVKRTLESKNYTVKTINLIGEKQMPEDADLVIIAGPQKPVSKEEVDLLNTYLTSGGALIILEEPTPLTQFGNDPDPISEYLSQNWGIQLGADLVIDPSSNQPTIAVGSQWGSHQITEKLQNYAVVLPAARSVKVIEAPQGVSQTNLVSTSARAWGETDLASLQNSSAQVEPNEDVDLIGPVPLAALAENFEQKGKIVVFGDSDFPSDAVFTAYGNGDFFVNSVDWSVGQENLINLTPKSTTQRLMLPAQQSTMNLILLGTVCLLPGLILLAGIVVWIQRRRKG